MGWWGSGSGPSTCKRFMFGWFRPTCPVEPHVKRWIEERLSWLSGQFGLGVFTRRAVILPHADFFSDRYDGSEESVRTLLDRVCGYMDADPALVEMELFHDPRHVWLVNEEGHYLPTAAGTYSQKLDKTIIRLDRAQISEPMNMVGTIAHELAHLRLLKEERIPRNSFDNELLTDLTVVFHGLGIFLANSPRAWRSRMSVWPGTDVRRPEYMSLPMYGYALAHAAWLRGKRKPVWAKYLRMDARIVFRQGARDLFETGDSSFSPEKSK